MPGGSFEAPTDQIELPELASDGFPDANDASLERTSLLVRSTDAVGGGSDMALAQPGGAFAGRMFQSFVERRCQ